jgi:type III secretion protein R
MGGSESLLEGVLSGGQGGGISHILILGILGLLPVAMISMTSYLKVSIVLSTLRNALGGGQIPSQAISGILALIITFFTMSPVLESCFHSFQNFKPEGHEKTSSFEDTIERGKASLKPVLEFLKLNTNPRERLFFFGLDAKRNLGSLSRDRPIVPPLPDEPVQAIEDSPCEGIDGAALKECLDIHERVSSLILSFVMSELRTACTMGIYLFLPFLVIDLIVSTILTGLGMMMVSPVTITLPLKLLLFVVSDGWRSLTESLILGYVMPGMG